jgi:hypothetical protein
MTFRMNHDLYREVVRIRMECEPPAKRNFPLVISARTHNANRYPIGYEAWREHILSVSKVRNFGSLKLDFTYDYSRERKPAERKPLTEAQKLRLKELSWKPSESKESIPLLILETAAA